MHTSPPLGTCHLTTSVGQATSGVPNLGRSRPPDNIPGSDNFPGGGEHQIAYAKNALEIFTMQLRRVPGYCLMFRIFMEEGEWDKRVGWDKIQNSDAPPVIGGTDKRPRIKKKRQNGGMRRRPPPQHLTVRRSRASVPERALAPNMQEMGWERGHSRAQEELMMASTNMARRLWYLGFGTEIERMRGRDGFGAIEVGAWRSPS